MAIFSVSDFRQFIELNPQESYWMGMDVHKRSYYVALCDSEGNYYTWSAPADPKKLIETIRHYNILINCACYEAGPTGFSLARSLIEEGIPCMVGAPNKIPRSVSPGSKTDRLDCIKLARYASKGLIRSIAIPSSKSESERALLRRRHQLTDAIRQVKQRIKAVFLFHGMDEPAELKHWSKNSRKRLLQLSCSKNLKLVLESHTRQLEFLISEQKIIEEQLKVIAQKDAHREIVDALKTVPGVGFITAITFHLELFEPERFKREEEVASYLGLAPTVKHSGEHHPRGYLVPVGQQRLRSLLIEASWMWVANDEYAAAMYRKIFSKSQIPQKAIAAVARKLAIILWRLSIEKRAYRKMAA